MNAPTRRGACPRLTAPMATGDGLLARLIPSGRTIGLDAFAGLCAAARMHGNGVIEITSRGSIQVRGLSAASSPSFADAVEPLGIDCGDSLPVLTQPLGGLDPTEAIDAGAIADALRRSLSAAPFATRLSAKISVIVDGGGALPLDGVSADVRLQAAPDGRSLYVALGGDASSASPLGTVAPEQAGECTMRLLQSLAGHAPQSRMRDMLRNGGRASLQSAVADLVIAVPPPAAARPARPIGLHRLRDGKLAAGLGLPFGHSDAETLQRLLDAAARAGAAGIRTAPGRALLAVGLAPAAAEAFRAEASSLGFIVEPDDPRCHVVACAGAPVCASGQIASRALAPLIAEAAGRAGGSVIHVSGCSKGCAHPQPTRLAVFGRDGVCDIRLDGEPVGSVTAEELPRRIASIVQSRQEFRGG